MNKKVISFSEDDMIEFTEWCTKLQYSYYFNGEIWQWANSKTQKYYNTKQLLELWKQT